LKSLRKAYEAGVSENNVSIPRYLGNDMGEAMSLGTANEITSNASSYPGALVSLAEERCRQDVAARVVPVADIALKDGWFDLGD
jgi:hypothetical protein